MQWQAEIEELHVVFQEYFLGATDSLDRVEEALANDFSIVGPDGNESNRTATMQALRAGHGHATSLGIRTADHQLLVSSGEIVVARYVEIHQLAETTNRRLSTVIFSRSAAAPNGLVWRRVHETWLTSMSHP